MPSQGGFFETHPGGKAEIAALSTSPTVNDIIQSRLWQLHRNIGRAIVGTASLPLLIGSIIPCFSWRFRPTSFLSKFHEPSASSGTITRLAVRSAEGSGCGAPAWLIAEAGGLLNTLNSELLNPTRPETLRTLPPLNSCTLNPPSASGFSHRGFTAEGVSSSEQLDPEPQSKVWEPTNRNAIFFTVHMSVSSI